MAEVIPPEEQPNYETFRECLSEPVLKALAPQVEKPKKKKRHGRKTSKTTSNPDIIEPNEPIVDDTANDADDLGEFIDYLSTLIFPSLPASLRTLSHSTFKDSQALQTQYSTPLTSTTTISLLKTTPPTALDSLTSYGLLPSSPDGNDLHNFFTPVFNSYIATTTAPPPIWTTTRTTECELCHREWIPLTYHHLIPKSTHERVLKRGWHNEDMLNSVAWLCRACHSFVHRCGTNEELAKSYWSLELLEERDDVQAWIKWIGRVRWKKR